MTVLFLLAALAAAPALAGDVQVGPAVHDEGLPPPADAEGGGAPPAPAGADPAQGSGVGVLPGMEGHRPKPRSAAKDPLRIPGLLPVFDTAGGWIVLDKHARSGKGALAAGDAVLVVGSRAADFFSVGRSTRVYLAACQAGKPARTGALFLTGRGMDAVGVPIIGLKVPRGRKVDPKAARFYRLINGVNESVYAKLGTPVRDAVLRDVKSGAFLFKLEDSLGADYGRQESPDPEKVRMKIDFGSRIRVAGRRDAFVLVEGAQISKTYRRCMRLFEGAQAVGECAEMPHDLRAETGLLEFVAYDPSGTGRPFVLAYTKKDPLWGHERWGFQMSKEGPRRFLMEALDPRCRDKF